MEKEIKHKSRVSIKTEFSTYILVIIFADGEMMFQLQSGSDEQPGSIMVGRAQLVEAIMADLDGEYAHVHVLRLHLFDAEHVGVDAADPIDPRLLALFHHAPYYVLGEGAEVYSVATGKVVGHLPEKAA